MSNIYFRPYYPSDFDESLEAFKSNVPKYFTYEEVSMFENFLKTFQSPTCFFVVEVDSKIIGCGGFGKRLDNDHLTLIWGLIHQDFHKKNYGKLFLEFRLNEIKRIFPNQNLYIDTTQHSFGFFEKYGFKTTKITEDYYTKGLHRYDMILELKLY